MVDKVQVRASVPVLGLVVDEEATLVRSPMVDGAITNGYLVEVPRGRVALPPRAGAGSGGGAWRAYAEDHGVAVPDDAGRDDVIAALDAAGVATEVHSLSAE